MLENHYVEIRRQFIHYIKMLNRNTEISPCLYNNSKVALFSYIFNHRSQFFHQKIDNSSREDSANIKKKEEKRALGSRATTGGSAQTAGNAAPPWGAALGGCAVSIPGDTDRAPGCRGAAGAGLHLPRSARALQRRLHSPRAAGPGSGTAKERTWASCSAAARPTPRLTGKAFLWTNERISGCFRRVTPARGPEYLKQDDCPGRDKSLCCRVLYSNICSWTGWDSHGIKDLSMQNSDIQLYQIVTIRQTGTASLKFDFWLKLHSSCHTDNLGGTKPQDSTYHTNKKVFLCMIKSTHYSNKGKKV